MSRKEDILKAAVQLFAEKGYSATSTSAIAKAAGVAEGLIFHHFQNKAGILFYIFTDLVELYLQEIEAASHEAKNGLAALEQILRLHFQFSERHKQEIAILMRDLPADLINQDTPIGKVIISHLNKTAEQFEECLERGKADGTIRDVSSGESAWIMRAMLDGIIRLENEARVITNSHKLAEEAVVFCIRSVAAPNAQYKNV